MIARYKPGVSNCYQTLLWLLHINVKDAKLITSEKKSPKVEEKLKKQEKIEKKNLHPLLFVQTD